MLLDIMGENLSYKGTAVGRYHLILCIGFSKKMSYSIVLEVIEWDNHKFMTEIVELYREAKF